MGTLELDDIQGIIPRGYRDLKAACYLLLEVRDPTAARRWIGDLAGQVTPEVENPQDRAINLAFTAPGLRKLGLKHEILTQFSHEFLAGMVTPHRSRQLGDVGTSAPERWDWGGPANAPVDVLAMVYARDEANLARDAEARLDDATAHGLTLTRRLDTSNLHGKEHFGFADGISQPIIEGFGKTGPARDLIRAGEFLLGYPNEYGLYTGRPTPAPDDDPKQLLASAAEQPERKDLGRNGSYLVFRQLEQDVRGFRRFLEQEARRDNPSGPPLSAEVLAAKIVGRWPSGTPLVRAPLQDDPSLVNENDFVYYQEDRMGRKCPIGSHVRRTNPRDSLDPSPGSEESIAVGKRHRLLRRGREYGNPLPEDGGPEGVDDGGRGLHFLAINANIARQFEFIQSTWANNPAFNGLYHDDDPLIGPRPPFGGQFSIPAEPVRRRFVSLPQFVTVKGGTYFFLPGLRALRYLGDTG